MYLGAAQFMFPLKITPAPTSNGEPSRSTSSPRVFLCARFSSSSSLQTSNGPLSTTSWRIPPKDTNMK
ncbi:unnamed protein product, partial [Musa hybrid cultivar]